MAIWFSAMDVDIYTRQPLTDPSAEHVFPDALGGRRKAPLISTLTNNTFGSTIDASLARSMALFRGLLGAKSGSGAMPPPVKGLKTATGERYDLLPGGKPQLGNAKFDVRKDDGVLKITGQARNEQEMLRQLRRVATEHGISDDQLRAAMQRKEAYIDPLAADVSFDAPFWRAVAKCACNVFADVNRAAFMDPAFDAIRAFVLSGTGDSWDFVTVSLDAIGVGAASPIGELDHVVSIHWDPPAGGLTAVVCFYRHVEFVVRLGVLPSPRVAAASYRVDSIGRSDRCGDSKDTLARAPKFVRMDVDDGRAHRARHAAAASAVLAAIHPKTVDSAIGELVGKALEEGFGPPDGEQLTEEQLSAFAEAAALRFVRLQQHMGTLPDEEDE